MSNDDLRTELTDEMETDACHIDSWPFTDLEDSVRDDLRRIRQDSLIPPDIHASGGVYEVEAGRLRPVEGAAA